MAFPIEKVVKSDVKIAGEILCDVVKWEKHCIFFFGRERKIEGGGGQDFGVFVRLAGLLGRAVKANRHMCFVFGGRVETVLKFPACHAALGKQIQYNHRMPALLHIFYS